MTTPELRSTRRDAIRAARDYVAHVDTMTPQGRMSAALDLAEYATFNAELIGRWLGVSAKTLREKYHVALRREANWGIERLDADHLDMAYDLAKAGVLRERPKKLILMAHEEGMSFIQIAALLSVHRQIVIRIVRRLEGVKPW